MISHPIAMIARVEILLLLAQQEIEQAFVFELNERHTERERLRYTMSEGSTNTERHIL